MTRELVLEKVLRVGAKQRDHREISEINLEILIGFFSLPIAGKISSEHRANSRFEKPSDYVQYLHEGDYLNRTNKLLACLESLRVALTSNPISWIKDFGEDGINEIVSLLRYCKTVPRRMHKIEYECLRCLKAILNNSWGLNVILTPDQHAVVLLLAQCIDTTQPHTMCEAIKLLSALTLLKDLTISLISTPLLTLSVTIFFLLIPFNYSP